MQPRLWRFLPRASCKPSLPGSSRAHSSATPRSSASLCSDAPIFHPPVPAKALELLGLLYRRKNDRRNAIASLEKVPARLSRSSNEAPASIYGIGRIYEEEKNYDSARSAYRRLLAGYPESKDAFRTAVSRIGWTDDVAHRYGEAVKAFKLGYAAEPDTRDLFDYWHARALEKNGNVEEARVEFLRLAQTTDSNYYPALATIRLWQHSRRQLAGGVGARSRRRWYAEGPSVMPKFI